MGSQHNPPSASAGFQQQPVNPFVQQPTFGFAQQQPADPSIGSHKEVEEGPDNTPDP